MCVMSINYKNKCNTLLKEHVKKIKKCYMKFGLKHPL